MSNFTPLYGSILTSTIWAEDADTRLVWITMLAMADAAGYVGASIPGLAHAARVPVESCEKAIAKFLGPDKYSRTKDHDGRRIVESNGGWTLLNYEKHRERASELRNNALAAIRMRKLRETRKKHNVTNVQAKAEPLRTDTVCSTDKTRHRQGIDKNTTTGGSASPEDEESRARIWLGEHYPDIAAINPHRPNGVFVKFIQGVQKFGWDVFTKQVLIALTDPKIGESVSYAAGKLTRQMNEEALSKSQASKPQFARPD
jgi:hypothetical protein